MKFCKDCWNFSRCNAVGRTVDFAVDDGVCREFDEVKNMTNADRIRDMTDEELCDLFREIYNAGCDDSTAYSWGRNTYSFVWDEEWLHAPAEGE